MSKSPLPQGSGFVLVCLAGATLWWLLLKLLGIL